MSAAPSHPDPARFAFVELEPLRPERAHLAGAGPGFSMRVPVDAVWVGRDRMFGCWWARYQRADGTRVWQREPDAEPQAVELDALLAR